VAVEELLLVGFVPLELRQVVPAARSHAWASVSQWRIAVVLACCHPSV
jgi:hypothetical protein